MLATCIATVIFKFGVQQRRDHIVMHVVRSMGTLVAVMQVTSGGFDKSVISS